MNLLSKPLMDIFDDLFDIFIDWLNELITLILGKKTRLLSQMPHTTVDGTWNIMNNCSVVVTSLAKFQQEDDLR